MTVDVMMRSGPESVPVDRRADRIAVIDIGSNSVRMVVYNRLSRAPLPIFNEKVLCGLGRGLARSGRLESESTTLALATLVRFVSLARAMSVGHIDAVATAAVREATNGYAFVDQVRHVCDLDVRVLSGADEARLSALGVLAATPGAKGIMGDLGGGSLELVPLDGDDAGSGATLPIGPLRLKLPEGAPSESAEPIIDAALANVAWLADNRGKDLYIVGGAWRALGHIDMRRVDYPLHILHGYAVPADQMHDVATTVARLGEASLRRIAGVSRERRATLPLAAQILTQLIAASEPKRIVFSAYGLREGLLYEQLSASERKQDPLLTASRDTAAETARFADQGEILFQWTERLFLNETPDARRLREAAAHLSDIGWRNHPDYRAEKAFLDIARGPFVGIDHNERARLAVMIYARYTGNAHGETVANARSLMTEEEFQRARQVGQALRLGHTISGGVPLLLSGISLYADGANELILEVAEEKRPLIGHVVEKRLQALAAALSLKSSIRADNAA